MCEIAVHQVTLRPGPSLLLYWLARSLKRLNSISLVQMLSIPNGWRVGVCQIPRQFDIQLHSVWPKMHQKPMWNVRSGSHKHPVEIQSTLSAILSQSSPSILVSRSVVESDWITGPLKWGAFSIIMTWASDWQLTVHATFYRLANVHSLVEQLLQVLRDL